MPNHHGDTHGGSLTEPCEHPTSTPPRPCCLATVVPLDFLYVQTDSLKGNFCNRNRKAALPASPPTITNESVIHVNVSFISTCQQRRTAEKRGKVAETLWFHLLLVHLQECRLLQIIDSLKEKTNIPQRNKYMGLFLLKNRKLQLFIISCIMTYFIKSVYHKGWISDSDQVSHK